MGLEELPMTTGCGTYFYLAGRNEVWPSEGEPGIIQGLVESAKADHSKLRFKLPPGLDGGSRECGKKRVQAPQ